jgi:hypothetical protein
MEKLLPQPLSCPLSMVAMAQAIVLVDMPAFQPALTTT